MKLSHRLPLFRRVARRFGAQLFHWAENNGCPDIERNGEAWLLDALLGEWSAAPSSTPRVVIDGGGNVGDFSARVLAAADARRVAVRVIVFEPSSTAQVRLRARFGGDARVRLVQAALGAVNGEASLEAAEAGSSQASLRRVPEGGARSRELVPVVALGEWLAVHGEARVDFLKLDVEGSELDALRGLGERLDPAVVPVLQFEYGGTTLAARANLGDFHRLLETRGYAVAKLLPRGLVRRSYAEWMDHFAYANYVALAAETPKP